MNIVNENEDSNLNNIIVNEPTENSIITEESSHNKVRSRIDKICYTTFNAFEEINRNIGI